MNLKVRRAADEFPLVVGELARVPALERNSGKSHYGISISAFRLSVLLLLSVTTSYATAADYFVAVDGRDSNSGNSQ